MSPRTCTHSYSALYAGSFVSYLFAILFFVSFCGGPVARSQASSGRVVPRLITSPIDVTSRTTVAGTKHPKSQPELDRGPVDPTLAMERMILVLGVSAEQEHQLRTLLDSQQTVGSPNYHHWLTPEEFGQKFGPSPQDIQQVTGWLEQQGFRVGPVAKGGRWIEFSGAAAQVQTAFQTQMHNYEVNGKMHFANASDISIPSALAPVVRGVASLHNFFSKPMNVQHGTAKLQPDATFVDSFGNLIHALSPGDFATIYNLLPLYDASPTPFNGAGQTIAIVARSNIGLSDVSAFRQIFGLPVNPPNVIVNGIDPGDVPGDDGEAMLDVEWAGAVAPAATIDVVVSATSSVSDGVTLSAAFIVDNNLAPVMSTSFGVCEQSLGTVGNAFANSLLQQAAAQGISSFVSAGDSGAAGCDPSSAPAATHGQAVNGDASPPFTTAVGGTEFDEALGGGAATFWNVTNTPTLVSAKGYIPEMAWNESCDASATCGGIAKLFAGGGGVSTLYATPSWQAGSLGIPGLNFPMRALPDVSLTAAQHDGYLVCIHGSCSGAQPLFLVASGTSAAAPAFAGIMAIIDQVSGGRQGLANYVLYPLAKAENFSNCNSSNRTDPATPNLPGCVFNDTTVGNNLVPGLISTTFNFTAGTGYDLATGLGSVDATNLAAAFAAQAGGFQGTTTTLTANPPQNPITITHGQQLNFAVSVNRAGTTGTPSGTVSLIASGGTLSGSTGAASAMLAAGAAGSAAAALNGIGELPGGTSYELVAHYPGDGVFAPSDSSALTLTVTPEPSEVAIAVPNTLVTYGETFIVDTFVASANHISGQGDSFPTGTNSLLLNTSLIATGPLNSFGQGRFFVCGPSGIKCPSPGGLSGFAASYSGDASFTAFGNSPTLFVTVNQAKPLATLSAPGSVSAGVPFTLTAQIQANGFGDPPSGTFLFLDGTTFLANSPKISGGQASVSVTLASGGNHSITATYSGDTNYTTVTSAAATVAATVPFNFNAGGSTSQTIPAGGTATYNINLANPGGFTGAVSFTCTGAPGGSTCSLSPNPANLTASTANVPVTVTVTNTANASLTPSPLRTSPFIVAGLIAGLLWGIRRQKPAKTLLAVLALVLVLGGISCGGGGSSTPAPAPTPTPRPSTTATLTVTGTSGSLSTGITLNLTITH